MSRRRPLRVVLAAALSTVGLATVVLAAPAEAARYTINPCATGRTPFPGSQMLSNDGETSIDNQCAAGRGFRMLFTSPVNRIVAGAGNGFRMRVPDAFPNAHIIQLSANTTIAKRNGDSTSLYTVDESNGQYNPPGLPQLTWAAGVTDVTGPFDVLQSPLAPTRSIIWRLSSAGSTDVDASTLQGASYVLNGMSVTMDDPTLPAAPVLTNTGLLDGTPQSGKRILTLSARDDDSGVHDVLVRAGSTQLANFGNGSECTYVSVEACPTSRSGDVVVDTTQLPDGPQVLSLLTIDAANNTQISTTPSFVVANRPAGSVVPGTPAPGGVLGPLNGNPKGTPIITAGTKSKKAPVKAQTITVGQHRKVSLIGRLLAADGTPMPGAQVDLTQTIEIPGGATTKLDSVTTDAKGVYRYAFTPASSVVVAVRYPGHVGSADYAAPGRIVKVGLRAHLSFKQVGDTHRGTPMKFTGNIDAYPVPAGGIRIAIQYHSLKGGWLNADVITTRSNGNFFWKHTFRTAAKYRLRARFVADKRVAAAPNVSHELRFRLR